LTRSEAAPSGESAPVRRTPKSSTAFLTTGEVAQELDLPPHVLRFWEAKFPQIKPLKRGGGRRYYRPGDVDLLRRIRQCLHVEGYTIRGVQKLLREGGLPSASPPAEEETQPALSARGASTDLGEGGADPAAQPQIFRKALEEVRRELLEILALLDAIGARDTPGSS